MLDRRDHARQEWLASAVPLLARRVFEFAGCSLPPVRVTCEWIRGGTACRNVIGQCWARWSGDDDLNLIFISPRIADPVIALEILVHELVHAVDDCANGHRGRYRAVALLVGLEGRMTATRAGAALRSTLVRISTELGEYPADRLLAA